MIWWQFGWLSVILCDWAQAETIFRCVVFGGLVLAKEVVLPKFDFRYMHSLQLIIVWIPVCFALKGSDFVFQYSFLSYFLMHYFNSIAMGWLINDGIVVIIVDVYIGTAKPICFDVTLLLGLEWNAGTVC